MDAEYEIEVTAHEDLSSTMYLRLKEDKTPEEIEEIIHNMVIKEYKDVIEKYKYYPEYFWRKAEKKHYVDNFKILIFVTKEGESLFVNLPEDMKDYFYDNILLNDDNRFKDTSMIPQKKGLYEIECEWHRDILVDEDGNYFEGFGYSSDTNRLRVEPNEEIKITKITNMCEDIEQISYYIQTRGCSSCVGANDNYEYYKGKGWKYCPECGSLLD